MLGQTLLGDRLRDLRSVLRYLRGRTDLDAGRLDLWGVAGYRSILESRFGYVPYDVVVPGVLTVGDLPDVTAAPVPPMIFGFVDPPPDFGAKLAHPLSMMFVAALRRLTFGLRVVVLASSLPWAILGAGCGQRNAYVPPPPPEVIVAVPQVRPATIYHDYPGTTTASEAVELRARVQGYLESINFADGSMVMTDQLLFVIDPRPYQAALQQAEADLESKKATAVEDRAIYFRTLSLIPSQAATREQAETDRGNWLVAQAGVLEARAALTQAQLNLSFTEIRAPISGKIGRRLVDIGNLVVANTTVLATIERYDPIYVYFNATQAQYLEYLRRVRRHPPGTLEATLPPNPRATAAAVVGAAMSPSVWTAFGVLTAAQPHYPVEVGLSDETGYPHRGYVDFADNTVNPATGTLLIRGVLLNPPPYYLAPGLFVRVRVPVRKLAHAVVVPNRALGTDQEGRFLLVVGPNNVIERRSVKVGARVDTDLRIIDEGIQPGERFVLEGLQQARPGQKVVPKEQVSGIRSQGSGI